jgi:hypothetical protein
MASNRRTKHILGNGEGTERLADAVQLPGYSAYFVDLSPSPHAEIIARTEERAA